MAINASEGLSKTTGFSPAGNEALILLAIDQGPVHPCFSEDILEEYAAVLARAKFASAGRDRGGARHVPQSG